jgi:lauroyl/myristoyl acyltransferase
MPARAVSGLFLSECAWWRRGRNLQAEIFPWSIRYGLENLLAQLMASMLARVSRTMAANLRGFGDFFGIAGLQGCC